jgi:hypothetical protein
MVRDAMTVSRGVVISSGAASSPAFSVYQGGNSHFGTRDESPARGLHAISGGHGFGVYDCGSRHNHAANVTIAAPQVEQAKRALTLRRLYHFAAKGSRQCSPRFRGEKPRAEHYKRDH